MTRDHREGWSHCLPGTVYGWNGGSIINHYMNQAVTLRNIYEYGATLTESPKYNEVGFLENVKKQLLKDPIRTR